jgi:hypothetical protein
MKVFFSYFFFILFCHKFSITGIFLFLISLQWFFKVFGIHDFLPNNEIMKILADLFCGPEATREVCSDVIFLLDGFDEKQLNKVSIIILIICKCIDVPYDRTFLEQIFAFEKRNKKK